MVNLLTVRHWIALTLLRGVLVQTAATEYTPGMIVLAMPICARSCFTSALQLKDCSMEDYALMSECLCSNVPVQSSFSTCAQQNCTVLNAAVSLLVENQVCEAYPRESRATEAVVAVAVTYAVSIPVIVARCTARIKYSNRLWSDDYTSIAATVFLLVLASLQLVCVKYGFGLHQWEAEIIENNAMLLLIVYTIVQCLARLAILLLYRRIFGTSARWFKHTVNALLVLSGIVGVSYTLLLAFQCWPIAAAWDLTIPNYKCYDFAPLLFSGSLLSIVADLLLMIIPIPELRKLHISGRKRFGVGFLFVIASLGVVTSIVRLQYLVKLKWSYDLSWDEIDFVVWSLIELLCIVVFGSLPALRPFFRSLLPTLTATWRRSTQSIKRSRHSMSRRTNETANSSEDQKDYMPYDPLQLHPLSSVRGGEEWTKLPDEPRIPPRAVHVSTSVNHVYSETARLPNYVESTRSYPIRKSRGDSL